MIDDASLPANVAFGPTGIPSGNYDVADFGWTTSPDPSVYVPIWGCGGESNFLGYCNRAATRSDGGVELGARPVQARRSSTGPTR